MLGYLIVRPLGAVVRGAVGRLRVGVRGLWRFRGRGRSAEKIGKRGRLGGKRERGKGQMLSGVLIILFPDPKKLALCMYLYMVARCNDRSARPRC